MPATTKPPEQWSAADKLATVMQACGLSGADLGAFCRERGLYPRQLARWRQAAEDANGPSAPSMADQRNCNARIRSRRERFVVYSATLPDVNYVGGSRQLRRRVTPGPPPAMAVGGDSEK